MTCSSAWQVGKVRISATAPRAQGDAGREKGATAAAAAGARNRRLVDLDL